VHIQDYLFKFIFVSCHLKGFFLVSQWPWWICFLVVTAVGRHDRKRLPANLRSMHAKWNKLREVNCVAVKYIF